MSQQELADRLKIHQNALSRYENGVRAMSAHFVHTLSQELKVPVEFFYEDESDPQLSTEAKRQELISGLQASREDVHWIHWLYRLAHPQRQSQPKRKS